MDTYRDTRIECTEAAVCIRGYYFPWGTKRIPYGSLHGMRRVLISATRGQFRIWGTVNPRHWANFDPKRPTKKIGFVLDVGHGVSPFVTPDDPDAFEVAVRAHVALGDTGGTSAGPVI